MSEGSPENVPDVRGSGAGVQSFVNRSRNPPSPRVRPWVAAEQKEIDESKATINNLTKKPSLKDSDVSNVNLLTRLPKGVSDLVPERPRPIVREPTKWMINPMISVTSTDEAVEEAVAEHEDFAMSVQLARAKADHSVDPLPNQRIVSVSTSISSRPADSAHAPLILPGGRSSLSEAMSAPPSPPARLGTNTHFGFLSSVSGGSTSAPFTGQSARPSSASVIRPSLTPTPPLPQFLHLVTSTSTSSSTTTASTSASTSASTATTATATASSTTTATSTPAAVTGVPASTTVTAGTALATISETPVTTTVTPASTNSGGSRAFPPARPPPSPPPRLSHQEDGTRASVASIHVSGPVGGSSATTEGPISPREVHRVLDDISGSLKHSISEHKFREVKQRIAAEVDHSTKRRGSSYRGKSVELTQRVLQRQGAVLGLGVSPVHGTPLFPTWMAHADMEPRTAAFSADGLLLAVGWGETKVGVRANEGLIKLYHAELGEPYRLQLPKKPAPVNAIAFSPDGTLMAVCAGHTVAIHTLPNFDMPREIDGGEGEFLCCCFSPDGLFLAAGGTSRQLTMWSTALGSSLSHMVLYTFPYSGMITSCRFSLEGQHVVVGVDGTGRATKRRISTGKIEATFDHEGVLCCALSPNGSMLAEAGRRRTLLLRDAASGDVVHAFAHSADILCCDFSPDGSLVAAGDASGSLIVRRIAAGVIEHSFVCAAEVRTCTFSPDGKRLAATGPEGKQLCVYWIPSARIPRAYSHKLAFENIGQLHYLAGHVAAGLGAHGQVRTTRDPMAGCDFSPDSTLVAARVKWGRHIVLYDSVRGTPVRSLSNPQVFTCLSFAPSGETIACGDCAGSLIIFDVRTGDRVNAFKHSVGIASLCYSRDGNLLATSDREGAIQIRRLPMGGLETPSMHGFLHAPPDLYTHRHSMCFAPDGGIFACAIGTELFVWRVFTLVSWALEHKWLHPKHDCPSLGGCAFSPDGRFLSVGAGKEVVIRSTSTWETVHVIPTADERHTITHICYSPNGEFLAVSQRCLRVILDGSPRNEVVVYRTANATFDQEFERSHELSHCAFSPDGKYLAGAGGDEGNLTVWRFFGPPITQGVHSKDYFASCVMSPDGRYVAIGGRECRVTVFTADTNEVKCTFQHSAPVACVAFSPDGRRLVSGGHDRRVVLWDEEGTEIRSWTRQASVQCCAFSTDGAFLAVGGADNKFEMIHLGKGVVVHSFDHPSTVNSCCFSSDHLWLACGGDDCRLTIRRVDTGERDRVFTHASAVTSICFSPDAALVVAGDSSSKVIVRRMGQSANLALLLSFTHSAPISNVYFSPDGELLLTCGEDGNLSVRPIQTGEVAYTLRGTHCCVRAPCPITKTQLFITFDGDLQTSRIMTPHLVDPAWLQHCSAASLEWLLEMGRLDPAAHDANGASLIGKLFSEQPHLGIVIARRSPPVLLLTTLEATVKATGSEGEIVDELLKAWGSMPICEGLPYGADGAVGVLARLVVASPETAARLLQKVFAPTQDAAGRGELHRSIEEIQTQSHRNLQMNVWHRGPNNPNDPAVHSLVSRIPGLLDPPQKWPVIRPVSATPQQVSQRKAKKKLATQNVSSVFHSATNLSDQPGKRALFETVFMKQAVIHKWKRIRFFFFAMMACYTAYVIFLYVSAGQIRMYAEARLAADPWPLCVMSILLSAIGACGQLLEMRNRWTPWNVGSLTSFALNAGVNAYYLQYGMSLEAFNSVSTLHAFALLFASIGMFSFLKVMPGTGPKVVMVISIMKDIRWFVVLVIVVMIAFGSAFVLIFPWDDSASNSGEQLLLMYRMVVGDFDSDSYLSGSVTRVFFVGFTFVVVVIFLNLLIAIMGDTYDRIKETEEVENYKALARYICDMEMNWEFFLHRRFCCGIRGNEYFYLLSPIADVESLGSSWEGRMQTMRRYVEEAVGRLGRDLRERDLRYDVKLDQANRRLVLMAGSDPLKSLK